MRMLRLPRHRATTAQLASLYPFAAQAPLPATRVTLGLDRLGATGVFRFCPFELYAARALTNPNMLVLGEPGSGKSAAVKTLCHRLARTDDGCLLAIIDPKGEYGALADTLGLTVVKLHPGGPSRLNPLEAGPERPDGDGASAARRATLLATLLATVLRRPLTPLEDAALVWSLESVERRPAAGAPTLVDLVALLAAPPAAMAERAGRSSSELARDLEDLRLGLGRLIERELRGMFDGRSTTRLDPDGPGVVLDLSALHHDPEALALVMVAATAWLQEALASPAAGGRRRVQVLDEAWALLASERTARYLQACFKLCRAWGVANVAVSHRASDLRAQADDGTATAKLGEGLLADTQTRVLFRQSPDQVPAARELLGLSATQADLLPRLGQGCALWVVGGAAHLVEHVIGAEEWPVCDTDGALVG